MNVTITKPDGNLYTGTAVLVQLPGIDGMFEIMNHHAPIVSALKSGTIRLEDENNETHTYNVRGGIVQFMNDNLEVLVQ